MAICESWPKRLSDNRGIGYPIDCRCDLIASVKQLFARHDLVSWALVMPMAGLRRIVTVILIFEAVVVAAAEQPAQKDSPRPFDSAGDVLPILRRHCFECHGPQNQEGGLRFDDRAAALTGGYSGPAFVPGKPGESELLRRARLPRDDEEAMPPRGLGLTPHEQEQVERWIVKGADWPEDVEFEKHWAYRLPVFELPPEFPEDIEGRGDELIDGWVAVAHAREGLGFADKAERTMLLRRVSFDLTGLPPSVDEQALFLADSRPDAYEQLVDRLLESEAFGVRWARMWLDLARYADSHGYQRDDLRSLWAYRDWVVAALNADMPFDRFTIEQVAGDLLPDADESTRIATGFHRCAPTNVEAGTDPEESRIGQVLDRVNTTGAVWLGTTLECAQCHDHKYDPFPQVDYYRMAAYFNSTETEVKRANPKVPSSITFVGPSMTLTGDPWAADRQRASQLIQRAEEELESLQLTASTPLPVPAVTPGEEGVTCGGEEAFTAASDNPDNSTKIESMQKRVRSLKKNLAELPRAETLVMQELATPRQTFLFKRGDFTNPGQPVVAGTPAILGGTPDGPPNRLTLARWLVDRDNPLTARVLVNRIWFEMFGRGLVATLEDFGIKGDPPTHPALLDSLAVAFMDDGWSIKRLIRRIVTSRTYRQTSQVSADLRACDPDNRWLARGPRFRLDAEAIRDNALAIAGLLSHEQGGGSIRPPQPDGLWAKLGGKKYLYQVSSGEQRYRRGLYVILKRGSPYPSLTAFDATDRMTCVVKRSRSNTPLQALVLLNDPVYTEAALGFARRLVTEQPAATADERIRYAFELALARKQKQAEIALLRTLVETEEQLLAADPKRMAEVLADHPTIELGEGVATAEVVAWYAVAAAILNLDETITKN